MMAEILEHPAMLKADAVRLLQEVVEESGVEYRTEACQYSMVGDEGATIPCCIVGQALSKWGLSGDELAALDANLTGSTLNRLVSRGVLPFISTEAADVLARAQRVQDSYDWPDDDAVPAVHLTWGVALEAALNV